MYIHTQYIIYMNIYIYICNMYTWLDFSIEAMQSHTALYTHLISKDYKPRLRVNHKLEYKSWLLFV